METKIKWNHFGNIYKGKNIKYSKSQPKRNIMLWPLLVTYLPQIYFIASSTGPVKVGNTQINLEVKVLNNYIVIPP